MILRSLFIILAITFCALLQSSFFSALPMPFLAVPVVYIVGVLLYQLTEPSDGCVWLISGGLLLDLLTVNQAPHVVSYSLSAFLGIVLAKRVFASRSLYAMIGLGASMWATTSLIEMIWMALRQTTIDHLLPVAYYSAAFWQNMVIFLVALLIFSVLVRRAAQVMRRQFILRN